MATSTYTARCPSDWLRARGRDWHRATLKVAVVLAVMVLAIPSGNAQQTPPTPANPRTPVPATAAPPADQGTGAPNSAADSPKVKVERGAKGKKVYRITEEIRIEGKIQKPEAFFFYQKSSINYDWQELKQDFVPRILESVSRSPF